MNRSEKFWNRTAESYNKSERNNVQSFNETMSKVKENLNPEDLVLDFACATGSISTEIANSVKEIHAIDTSEKMIEIAKRNIANSNIENILFECSTIFNDRYKEGGYNAVLAFNILHLLEDTELTVQRIKDLLKLGGVFISSTVCLGDKMSFLGVFLSLFSKLGIIPYVKTLKFTQLKDLILNKGFQIVDMKEPDSSISNYFIVAKRVE